MNILIVEDEFLIAFDLATILEGMGHTVQGISATVDNALSALDGGVVAVAFVDTQLAERDAEPVVRACERNGVRIIICSGHSEPALPSYARGRTLLRKPFNEGDVVAAMHASGQ